jgi:putative ABC transport system permease protein
MTVRAVPLARRNFFEDRRRAVLAVAGLAASLVLVLVLDGIFAGAMRQVTAYLRNLPADVIVSQKGVRTMHMSASALPEGLTQEIQSVRGVAWAEPIRYTSGTIRSRSGSQLAYLIGYDTATDRAGPWDMATGRKPGPGEVVLDEVAADRLRVGPGDHVQLLGRDFVVSGLSRGGTSITNSTAFVRMQDFAAIRGPSVSYLLVGATPGTSADVLRQRLARARPDTTVQTRDEFVDQERAIVRDMSADIMQIMTVIAFLIAVAVIALTLFAATLAKLREYAVVKAIGADTRRLTWTVVEQSIWAIGLALVVSVLVSLAVAGLVATATPNVRLAIEPASVVRVAGAGIIAGTLGALAPLRRVARVDPSTSLKG